MIYANNSDVKTLGSVGEIKSDIAVIVCTVYDVMVTAGISRNESKAEILRNVLNGFEIIDEEMKEMY